MKLPKPHLIGGTFLPISGFEGSDYGYTEAQMLQFRRDALEEAEAVCRSLATTDCIDSNITRHECADAIKILKEDT